MVRQWRKEKSGLPPTAKGRPVVDGPSSNVDGPSVDENPSFPEGVTGGRYQPKRKTIFCEDHPKVVKWIEDKQPVSDSPEDVELCTRCKLPLHEAEKVGDKLCNQRRTRRRSRRGGLTMSIATWKKKYCPRSAEYYKGRKDETILKRDIRKWKELYPSKLKRHGLRSGFARLTDDKGNFYSVDTETCGLCQNYFYAPDFCSNCPLFIVRGEVRCDSWAIRKEAKAPFGEYLNKGNPKPMIKWLEKALEMVTKKG